MTRAYTGAYIRGMSPIFEPKDPRKKMRITTTRLAQETVEHLDRVAQQTGRTRAEVIDTLLKVGLSEYEKERAENPPRRKVLIKKKLGKVA